MITYNHVKLFYPVPAALALLWHSSPHIFPLNGSIPRLRPDRHVAHITNLSGEILSQYSSMILGLGKNHTHHRKKYPSPLDQKITNSL